MDEPVLYYFEGRGRAEIIRLMLTAANMPFKSKYYKQREEFLQDIKDGKLLFEASPMLQLDNMNIVQTSAIVRYLARRNGMDGETSEEKCMADVYFEGTKEFYGPFMIIGFVGSEKEVAAKAAKTVLPKYLPIFNRALAKSTSGYIVGSKLTHADVGLLEVLLAIEDFYEDDKLADYPHVKTFLMKMKNEDWVIKYIKDVRMKKNDDEYVAIGRRVLNWYD